MAIEKKQGDLLKADVDAIVNTVNCVGVMGKGIALQFKQKWPENFKAYEQACKRGEVVPGKMFVYDSGGLVRPHFIINFPTKKNWREKSKIEYVTKGLDDLVNQIKRLKITSIAVPPLGCGNGGLINFSRSFCNKTEKASVFRCPPNRKGWFRVKRI